MNFKDILLPIALVFITTSLVQYVMNKYTAKNSPQVEQVLDNQSFTAPTTKIEVEPLNTEVDFSADKKQDEKIETVNFGCKTIKFSNYGAVISDLVYKVKDNLIEVITPKEDHTLGAFLVAFNGLGSTPLYYDLVNKQEDKDKAILTYKSSSNQADITKTFTVYNSGNKIDLNLVLEPKKDKIKARVLFPSPVNLGDYYTNIDSVFYSEKNKLEHKPLADVQNFGKNHPTFFGLESHYLVNLLTSDVNKFAQRAYYKITGANAGQAILESNYIDQKTEYNLSFYCGPKDIDELNKIDNRLGDLLGYGWFTRICQLALKLLNWLYELLKSYGWAIVALAFLVRIMTLAFTFKTGKTLKKEAEQRQKLAYLEQKYKNDPEMLNQVKLEHFKSNGLLDFIRFLLAISQLPILISLNRILSNGIQLYKAPFLWIQDLSMPDPMYILQIIFAITVTMQMSELSPTPNKQKTGGYYLSMALLGVLIMALTSSMASGLSLYLSCSAIFAILQTKLQKMF